MQKTGLLFPSTFGAQTTHDGRTLYLHDLLMNPPIGLEVDHLNGSGLMNCRWNLRICTHQENLLNSRRCEGQACIREMLPEECYTLGVSL